jgi:hypothetical protein
VVIGADGPAGERSAATATDLASLGSFLPDLPEDSSRTREPSLGYWMSRTRGEHLGQPAVVAAALAATVRAATRRR